MDNEDMILPEGFEDTPTTEPEVDTQNNGFDEPIEPDAEDTKPAEEPTEPTEPLTQLQKLKLTYNGQELEIEAEEAKALAQKGMNYEKAVERARQEAAQEARDAFIAGQGYTWNDKPITTEAEYKQAMAEQEMINKYKDRDLPPEVIQELVESRRDREERQREKAAKEEESKQQAAFDDFFKYFESVNERRFDPQKDILPQEVRDAVNNGQPLKHAYMEHHNKELRNQLKIAKQNEVNKTKSPVGSVTAGGGIKTEAEDDFMAGFNSI